MTIYEKAPQEVCDLVAEITSAYHGPLFDADVTFDLLFAHAETDDNGDAKGPALKLHGYQCAAVVRIVPYKQRVLGQGDAEIVFDGDRWDEWSDEQKRAIVDHEIEHLELAVDREGNVKRDDLDRPKLKMRKHDHQFGWFDSIARRHGQHSFEVQQYDLFTMNYKQLWLDFKEEQEPARPSGKPGVTTVTLSAGDKSVTMTSDQFAKASERIVKAARRPTTTRRAAAST